MDYYYVDKKCLEDLIHFQNEMMTVTGRLYDLCKMGDELFKRFNPVLRDDRLVEPFREIEYKGGRLSELMYRYARRDLQRSIDYVEAVLELFKPYKGME